MTACSTKIDLNQLSVIPHYQKKYILIDRSGKFIIHKEGGLGRNNLLIQKSIIKDISESKVLEKVVLISKIGKYKNITMARPERSIYQVWFEGKKYTAVTKILTKEKKLQLKLTSPEEQWNGTKIIDFPNLKSVYCYYSQLIDCISVTGFFNKAILLKNGEMKLIIIWDGYPYIQEQYLNISKNIFSKSTLVYDGKNKDGEFRFSLDIGNQKILYFIDPKIGTYRKLFWVSQGMSIIENGD